MRPLADTLVLVTSGEEEALRSPSGRSWASGTLRRRRTQGRTSPGGRREEREEVISLTALRETEALEGRLDQSITLTLSLLAPGLDRSWSECCWFQLELVGPDMLRPTPGYAPI